MDLPSFVIFEAVYADDNLDDDFTVHHSSIGEGTDWRTDEPLDVRLRLGRHIHARAIED